MVPVRLCNCIVSTRREAESFLLQDLDGGYALCGQLECGMQAGQRHCHL